MSKYGARRTPCHHGHTHDSAMEALRCNDLHLMARAGAISDLEQQPEFRCEIEGRAICVYRADFAYRLAGETIVEDVKGVVTPVFTLKRKLVEALHHGVRITLYPPKRTRASRRRVAA